MKVAVIPDAAMIVVPLIEKNGHEYISPTNFSKYNNMDVSSGKCDDTQAPYTLNRDNILLGSSYFSNELPSGVKGRLTLFSRVLELADAFIVLGKRPEHYKRMYDVLKNLTSINGIVNEDNLDIDLKKPKKSLNYKEFKKILDDLIYY